MEAESNARRVFRAIRPAGRLERTVPTDMLIRILTNPADTRHREVRKRLLQHPGTGMLVNNRALVEKTFRAWDIRTAITEAAFIRRVCEHTWRAWPFYVPTDAAHHPEIKIEGERGDGGGGGGGGGARMHAVSSGGDGSGHDGTSDGDGGDWPEPADDDNARGAAAAVKAAAAAAAAASGAQAQGAPQPKSECTVCQSPIRACTARYGWRSQ